MLYSKFDLPLCQACFSRDPIVLTLAANFVASPKAFSCADPMARLRKGKDAVSKISEVSRRKVKKSSNHDDQELKSQIIALGGNEEDFELVKDTEHSGIDSGDGVVDVSGEFLNATL